MPAIKGRPKVNRAPAKVLTDRAEITKLKRRGWSNQMIAEHLGVAYGTVCADWKVVITEITRHRDEDAKALIAEKLEEIAEIKKEAWEGWIKSKEDAMKRVEESISSATGAREKNSLETVGQTGNPSFLATVIKCVESECKLLCLFPDKKTIMMGGTGEQVPWDLFHTPPQELDESKVRFIEGKVLEAREQRG
jgi:hypothetical protein